MIKILCDEVDIPCMIKYSDVTIGHHANNLVVLKDNSDSMHLLHVDATIDCLNHSIQNVRKFNDYDLITRINGLLIAEEDINKYHKCQQYIDCLEQAAYFRLINLVEPQKLFEVTEEDEYIYDSFCEMMLDKVEHLTPNLVEMCKFLNITYEISTESEIIETYRLLQDVYEKIIIPISSEEILKAMYSVYTSLLIYNNDENNIDDKVNIMLLKKIQLSLEFQLKNYNNENGKSFMFELVNSINKR